MREKKLFNLQLVTMEEEPEIFHEVEEQEWLDESDNVSGRQNIATYAVNGSSEYNTFKTIGQVKGIPVLILIDSGSTHNIINSSLIEELQLEAKPGGVFQVSVANGKLVT